MSNAAGDESCLVQLQQVWSLGHMAVRSNERADHVAASFFEYVSSDVCILFVQFLEKPQPNRRCRGLCSPQVLSLSPLTLLQCHGLRSPQSLIG